jgi:DNA-binding beta-propeller fold protein YncE
MQAAAARQRWFSVRHDLHAPRRVFASIVLLALVVAGCSRSRSQAAAASKPQLPAVEYIGEWGTAGDDPGQLNDPIGPAVDDDGRIYVADRGAGSIEKFETGGVPLLSFDDASARSAAGIAVDRGGGIYVADGRNGLVQIFFPEGDFIRSFHIAPLRNWQGPFAFSIDDGGKVYVPDPGGGRIQVFDSKGRIEHAWKVAAGAGGQAGHPAMAIAGPSDGSVYVGDWQAGRILKYSSDGRQIMDWGEPASGAATPLLSLGASTKYLFALRDAAPRLEIWTLDGHLKTTDNLGGRLDAASPGKASLAVSGEDELVVLDPAGPRVLRFRTHLDAP